MCRVASSNRKATSLRPEFDGSHRNFNLLIDNQLNDFLGQSNGLSNGGSLFISDEVRELLSVSCCGLPVYTT